MQEVSQIVAWIKESPEPGIDAQRILIFQDKGEIYTIFPATMGNWARYIKGDSIARAGFMTMRQFGPWELNVVS